MATNWSKSFLEDAAIELMKTGAYAPDVDLMWCYEQDVDNVRLAMGLQCRVMDLQQRIVNGDALHPLPQILIKLGSIAVHIEELFSEDGHFYDRSAIESLLEDSELKAWLSEMDRMAFLPRKRNR